MGLEYKFLPFLSLFANGENETSEEHREKYDKYVFVNFFILMSLHD